MKTRNQMLKEELRETIMKIKGLITKKRYTKQNKEEVSKLWVKENKLRKELGIPAHVKINIL